MELKRFKHWKKYDEVLNNINLQDKNQKLNSKNPINAAFSYYKIIRTSVTRIIESLSKIIDKY